jgi:PTS system mannose-specific IIA component
VIGIILVTHGGLADEMKKALEHIVGPQEHLIAIGIEADDVLQTQREEILIASKKVNVGRGVIVLTDLFGGTPSNLAVSILQTGVVDVVAGMNLPMLLKLSAVRNELSLEDAVLAIEQAAKKYITVASTTLKS